ncbi:MAG: hypothetical protein ACLSFZ_00625 [Frisingicoccus sp.]
MFDLGKLALILPRTGAEEMGRIWDSRVSYVGCIYGKTIAGIPLGNLNRWTEQLLIYAITHKKRHFLKLAEKHGEKLERISCWSMLTDEDFYHRFVNLNTLNERDLLDSLEYRMMEDSQKMCMSKPEYTFEEIRCLHNQKVQYIQLYHRLVYAGVDERLSVFREIRKKQCLPGEMTDTEMELLGRKLSEKKLSIWMKDDFAHIRGLTAVTAVRILICHEKLSRFLPEIESELQAKYVLRNCEKLSPYVTMADFNQHLLEIDQAWLKMKEDFQFSGQFIQENRNVSWGSFMRAELKL